MVRSSAGGLPTSCFVLLQKGVANEGDRLAVGFDGRGDDLVDGADGANRDTATCGPGKDFFDADPGDKVDLNTCEKPF